jgi:hypothetical protein
MNMTPKSMSSLSFESDNIVMRLNSDERNERNEQTTSSNYIKFKLDDTGVINPKRNIIQKKLSDYDDYLDRTSSNKSKKRRSSGI